MEIRIWRDFNFFLLGCVLVLLGISLLSVYSATLSAVSADGSPMYVLFSRHIQYISAGLVVMVLVALIDYRLLSGLAIPFYVVAVAVLALVLLLGQITGGAQSWIGLGTRTIQPSELTKLLVIIVLASYWAHFEETSNHWLIQLGGLALAGLPLLLVMAQPDLGTAVVFGAIWLVMAWGAGMRHYHLLVVVACAVPLVILGWQYVLDYEQQSRLLTFYWLLTEPSQADPNDAYNTVQALNAIGSGGLFGAGLTNGLLSQGNYIPVQYSDFIFAVIGEELGFVGGTVMLIFQGILLWLILSIANDARDMFGRMIALGVFGLMLSHVVINVGMAMGVLPVTGLPLPFISYGGSFTLTTLIAIGLLQSIRMHRRRIVF